MYGERERERSRRWARSTTVRMHCSTSTVYRGTVGEVPWKNDLLRVACVKATDDFGANVEIRRSLKMSRRPSNSLLERGGTKTAFSKELQLLSSLLLIL